MSTSRRPLSEDELLLLLRDARQHNRRHAITGILLHCQSNFMQVLEGSEEAVDTLYEHIRHDRRHNRPILLSRRPIEKRAFRDWSMGFHSFRSDELANVQSFSRFLEDAGPSVDSDDYEGLAAELLDQFRQNYRPVTVD